MDDSVVGESYHDDAAGPANLRHLDFAAPLLRRDHNRQDRPVFVVAHLEHGVWDPVGGFGFGLQSEHEVVVPSVNEEGVEWLGIGHSLAYGRIFRRALERVEQVEVGAGQTVCVGKQAGKRLAGSRTGCRPVSSTPLRFRRLGLHQDASRRARRWMMRPGVPRPHRHRRVVGDRRELSKEQ